MHACDRVGRLVILAAIVVTAPGCRRGEPVPPAEVQSATVQPANQPTTIKGCLKAGEAPDTFVVTAARTEGSSDTATYDLLSSAGVNLADHIGRQVEVSGVIKQTQELASRDRAQPTQPAATTGTAGKPVVETRTEVDIKRLEVSSIKRLGDDRCD
jgi:hypothetical protein